FAVAAGAERREQALVDTADRLVEIALQHAVKLDALARGDRKRAVAAAVGEIVECEVLVRRDFAARDLAADHEHVVLADAALGAILAGVAVVLLIGAVELQQLLVLIVEVVGVFKKLEGDGAAQGAAGLLDALDRGALDRWYHRRGRSHGPAPGSRLGLLHFDGIPTRRTGINVRVSGARITLVRTSLKL